MSNFVRVPVQDWQNICNNFRTATGRSDLLKSGDIVEESMTTLHMDAALLNAGGAYPKKSKFVTVVYIPEDAVYLDLDTFADLPFVDTVYLHGKCEFEQVQEYDSGSKSYKYFNVFTKNLIPLKKLVVGAAYKDVPSNFVSGVPSLQDLTLENGIETIGDSAFYSCTSLKSITIPDTVKTVSRQAFSYCSAKDGLIIGSSVETIGEGAFSSLKFSGTLIIPDSVTNIGNHAFNGCDIKGVQFGKGLTELSAYSFVQTDLESVVIPGNIETINNYAFQHCNALAEIILEEGIKTIGAYAFQGTIAESITIPRSVTNMSTKPFYNSTALPTLRVYSGSYAEQWAITNSWPYEVIT